MYFITRSKSRSTKEIQLTFVSIGRQALHSLFSSGLEMFGNRMVSPQARERGRMGVESLGSKGSLLQQNPRMRHWRVGTVAYL